MLAITGFAVTGSSAGPSSPGPSAQATQLASIITGKLTSLIMGEVDKQIQKMCKQTPDEGEEERVDEVIITQSS